MPTSPTSPSVVVHPVAPHSRYPNLYSTPIVRPRLSSTHSIGSARHGALIRSPTLHTRAPPIECSSLCTRAHNGKNWIHVGSQQAGPKVAAILSIVETCRRLKIPVRAYLAAVLPGIADVSIQRLADLTPAAWAARKQ